MSRELHGLTHQRQPTAATGKLSGSIWSLMFDLSGGRKQQNILLSRSINKLFFSSLSLSFFLQKKKSVPVYVMLPLDTVGVLNVLNHRKALSAGLLALKSVGVEVSASAHFATQKAALF